MTDSFHLGGLRSGTPGSVEIVYIQELALPTAVRWMFGEKISREAWERCASWMQPHYQNERGHLRHSIHMFALRTPDRLMMVDTGVGNGKDRSDGIAAFDQLDTDLLARLDAAGVDRFAVDTVLCTHMHGDHLGWNTHREGDRWVPTFPNARHLFVDTEWAHWQATAQESEAAARLMGDTINPIADAGLVDLVPADYQLHDAIRFVPSHGHTPGHITIEVTAGGVTAALIGDSMHTPLQAGFPEVSPSFDRDVAAAVAGRRGVLERYAETDTLVLGAHWSFPPGRIRRDGDAYRVEAAEV